MVHPTLDLGGRSRQPRRASSVRRGRRRTAGRPHLGISQQDVVTWLATPATHEPGVEEVEQVETHSSIIFLAGPRAYKLKRAVRYDYLDYSSVGRRHTCCRDEVRLNRRTAPMLYRGVRAVTVDPDGSLAFDGAGQVVDWLVEMNRFDQDSQLDRLAERAALDLCLMPHLAEAVVRLHDVAEWRFDHGGLEGMSWVIQGNRDGFRRYGPGSLDDAVCERVSTDAYTLMQQHTDRLERRRLTGFVRHGHGDLHLGNVCLVDGTPVLFDGVEFNARIACVDVMYDLAFLLMDLIHRDLDRHANTVLNHYVERTRDVGGLRVLPLFLSARAAVRAKTSATSATLQTNLEEADDLRRDARRYLTLAETMLMPDGARLVAVGGGSGSGKTTLARRLAAAVGAAPGAIVLRSDLERKRLMGVSPQTRLGADSYAGGVTRQVYRILAERAREILAEGHAVIVDAVYGDPVERAMLADVAKACGVPFTGFWLDAPLATLTARLESRTDDASDATAQIAARQLDRHTAPTSWIHLDATGDAERVWHAAWHEVTTS